MALQPDLLGGHNTGFLREDALLAVVVLSDEDDCGNVDDVYELTIAGGNICYFASKGVGPEPGNPVYTPITYHPGDPQQRPYRLTPVEDYYNFLVNDVKGGRAGLVKFAAIVGVEDVNDLSTTTIEYEWGTQNRWEVIDACTTPGCTGDYCFAMPGTRYIKMAQLFGIGQNGIEDTICQNDFTPVLERLGRLLGCPKDFILSDDIGDPASTDIYINGYEVPRYSCTIPGVVEACDGPGDNSCSQGSCVETWSFLTPSAGAPHGTIRFADHHNPCACAHGGDIRIQVIQ